MFKLVEKIKMKHIRKLEPLLPKLEGSENQKIDVIFDIAVVLIETDKSEVELRKQLDDLDVVDFNILAENIVKTISSLEDIKKKQTT